MDGGLEVAGEAAERGGGGGGGGGVGVGGKLVGDDVEPGGEAGEDSGRVGLGGGVEIRRGDLTKESGYGSESGRRGAGGGREHFGNAGRILFRRFESESDSESERREESSVGDNVLGRGSVAFDFGQNFLSQVFAGSIT